MKGKIFNAQEVQAILDGSKVMFREVIKPQPIQLKGFSDVYFDCYSKGNPWNCYTKGNKHPLGTIAKCPYLVGQKIFVKESFVEHDNKILFKASHQKLTTHFLGSIKWRPAQHMKREHSRLTLLIKEIRVEKLIPITQENCVAEGVKFGYKETNWGATKAFKDNWNATHKKPEEKFEANPFVWVVDFKINK